MTSGISTAAAGTNADAARSFFIFIADQAGRIRRALMPSDVQIGRRESPAALQLTGRFSISVRDIIVTAANGPPVQVNDDDSVVGLRVQSTPLPTGLVVKLPPAPVDGQLHFIKDASGTAAVVPITVMATSGKIDEQAAVVISTSYGRLGIVWSMAANGWHTIAG